MDSCHHIPGGYGRCENCGKLFVGADKEITLVGSDPSFTNLLQRIAENDKMTYEEKEQRRREERAAWLERNKSA